MVSDKTTLLNELAQGLVKEEEGRQWFSALPSGEQREVLHLLWFFAAQAGANRGDVDRAIELSGLSPGFTPCVLVKRGPLSVAAAKVANLPHVEHEKSFRLLLALFRLADERRLRTECKEGCSHPWHGSRRASGPGGNDGSSTAG